jgi:hypothetical protein
MHDKYELEYNRDDRSQGPNPSANPRRMGGGSRVPPASGNLFGICLFTKTKIVKSVPFDEKRFFSLIFHPTMSNALKKRKIAVLGSRSVGEFQFQDDEKC